MRPVNGASLRFSSAAAYRSPIKKHDDRTHAVENVQETNVSAEKDTLRLNEENMLLKAEVEHLWSKIYRMEEKQERSAHLEQELRIALMRVEDMKLYISRKEAEPLRPEVERIGAESIRCDLPDGEYDVRMSIDGTKLRVRPKAGGYGTCNDGVLYVPKLGDVSEFHGVMGLSYQSLKEGTIEINLEDPIDSSIDVFQRDTGTRTDAAAGISKEE